MTYPCKNPGCNHPVPGPDDECPECFLAHRHEAGLGPSLSPGPHPTDIGARTTDAVLTERGSRYGKFVDHARVTRMLKSVMRSHDVIKWENLADDQKEALDMIAHKIGRVLNGDPDYEDSWRDVAGYAQLVADRLKGLVR